MIICALHNAVKDIKIIRMNVHLNLIQRIILTVVIITAATALQLILWPYIEPAPTLFIYPAILISCLYAEGLTAILFGTFIIHYFFIPPYDTIHFYFPRDLIRLLIFLPTAFMIKLITDNLLKLRINLEATIKSLRDEKELREKFVFTLSHDLHTPLTAMKMASQLMIKNRQEEEVFKRNSQRLQFNMTRIENMIKDLLDANKIRAGKLLPVEVAEMDLNECILSSLDGLNSIFGQRFIYHRKEQLHGYWSRDALQRILENLCTNAVKYGYSDTPITITVENKDSNISLSVQNFGPVIENEEYEYLFSAFEQSRSAHISKKKGWGLGLTLVRGLTEAMHGRVYVHSNHDSGTTFIVELPLDARNKQEA